jgi:hypothetical protein
MLHVTKKLCVQFNIGSLEHHIHWFCPNDLSHNVGGIAWKYVVAKLSVPTIWLIQEGIDLIQKEVITFKKLGLSFDHSHVQSLFGS